MMAANNSAITKTTSFIRIFHTYRFIIFLFRDYCLLTRKNESIDGDTVVLVLFVGVGASQTKTSQEGSEEVKDEPNDDQGCCSTKIT